MAAALTVVEPLSSHPTPRPPAGLLPASHDRWRAFWASRMGAAVDPDSDLPGLERWILAYDEWHRASKALRKVRVVKGSMGQPVLSPMAAYVGQLASELRDLERAYGMTPKARLDLGLTVAETKLTVSKINDMVRASADERHHDDDEATIEGEIVEGWEAG
jgi:P27 family predicted phage terminase small subunit